MASRKLLITGATGKQGGAVIDALLSSNSPTTFEILALTRNTSSAAAKALADRPHVTLVQGTSETPAPIFSAHKVDAIFLVTAPTPGKQNQEEAQAYPLIDAAVAAKVKHLVFTSVDRGGPDKSEDTPTEIAHFASKHRIEKYLVDKAKAGGMTYTILRPAAFYDNLTPNFMGKAFTSMWAGVGEKPLQLVAVKDIGVFGAKALLSPNEYKGRAISLAGDELNVAQARTAFKNAVGQPLPETFGFVGTGVKYMVGEMGQMFTWFRTDGYGTDIQALRKEYPQLLDFGSWLKQESGFKNAS